MAKLDDAAADQAGLATRAASKDSDLAAVKSELAAVKQVLEFQHEELQNAKSELAAVKSEREELQQSVNTHTRQLYIEFGSKLDQICSPGCSVSVLGSAAILMQEMSKLGWKATDPDKARTANAVSTFHLAKKIGLEEKKRKTNSNDGAPNSSTTQLLTQRLASGMMRAITSDKTKVVLLLDQSNSVGKDSFENEVKEIASYILRQLEKHAPGSSKFGAVAFGPVEVIGTEESVTSNVDNLIEHIRKHQYPGSRGKEWLETNNWSGTPTTQALHAAATLLQGQGSIDEVRIVFLITDGDANDVAKAAAKFQTLSHNGIVVVAIGVGNDVDKDLLVQMSTPGLCFQAADFTLLGNVIKSCFEEIAAGLKKASEVSVQDLVSKMLEASKSWQYMY